MFTKTIFTLLFLSSLDLNATCVKTPAAQGYIYQSPPAETLNINRDYTCSLAIDSTIRFSSISKEQLRSEKPFLVDGAREEQVIFTEFHRDSTKKIRHRRLRGAAVDRLTTPLFQSDIHLNSVTPDSQDTSNLTAPFVFSRDEKKFFQNKLTGPLDFRVQQIIQCNSNGQEQVILQLSTVKKSGKALRFNSSISDGRSNLRFSHTKNRTILYHFSCIEKSSSSNTENCSSQNNCNNIL